MPCWRLRGGHCRWLHCEVPAGRVPALMRIGVPKETVEGERRVALVPEVVRKLVGADHVVLVERGAGAEALIPDGQFEEAGASLTDDLAAVWESDVVVQVAPASAEEMVRLGRESIL